MIGRAEPVFATIIVIRCLAIRDWKQAKIQIKYCKLNIVTAIKLVNILNKDFNQYKQEFEIKTYIQYLTLHWMVTIACGYRTWY